MEPGEQDGFSWKWILLETPWVDPSGEAKAQFPMPLMCVDTPMGGVANLVCASALWHLLPSKTTVGDFFKSTGNDEFWSFATALGASQEQHLLPPKRSLTMKEKKEGWEPPPPGSLARRFMVSKYFVSPLLLLCSMGWLARNPHQAKGLQIAARSIIKAIIGMTASLHSLGQMGVHEVGGCKCIA